MKMTVARSASAAWLLASAALIGLAPAARAVLPPVPVPPGNPITEEKRVLGKILFWDEQLSTSNVVACATCHQMTGAGTDPRPRVRNPGSDGVFNTPDDVFGSAGIVRSDADNDMLRDALFGTGVQVTGRAANSPINAAYAPQLFWDGRAGPQFIDPQTGQVALNAGGALEAQSVAPPVSSTEMGHDGIDWSAISEKLRTARPLALATSHPADVASALAGNPSYPELFRRAFGTDQINARRIAFAIATYERTLISDQTPWDRFLAGDNTAMTPQQVQGFNAFQAHSCAVCHSVANQQLTGFGFRNIGLRPPQEDLGRQVVTGDPNDRGRFKVPGLRNVGLKNNFMHNGMFTTLTQVIQFYARAPGAPVQFADNRDPVMNQIVPLPPQDAQVIQDFLQNALTDPRVANRTFPFDHPTLFINRAADQATNLGGGAAGSGGIIPRTIVLSPGMLGIDDFRIGLDGALGGANAELVISFSPPVNGRINPARTLYSGPTEGVGAGLGIATAHSALSVNFFQPGQVIFAQWRVTDPAGPAGTAFSTVARIPLFCGSTGCPPCDPDLNADGNADQDDVSFLIDIVAGGDSIVGLNPDFNKDGNLDQDDVTALIGVLAGGACP
ncbi:MAG: hypothetical protein DYG92_02885 [Leptolyngbya sp. PLA1]|nr:hypothetical protein [Leptolyngbya sp. PLA1]